MLFGPYSPALITPSQTGATNVLPLLPPLEEDELLPEDDEPPEDELLPEDDEPPEDDELPLPPLEDDELLAPLELPDEASLRARPSGCVKLEASPSSSSSSPEPVVRGSPLAHATTIAPTAHAAVSIQNALFMRPRA